MKKYFSLLVIPVIVIVGACSNKDSSLKIDDKRVLMQNTTDEGGLQRMQVSESTETVTFNGKQYRLSLRRMPDDDLPKVRSEVGDLFVDNAITLRIKRGNEKIVDKTFTKNSFSSVVSASFLKKAILEGMVYDKITSRGIVFAVSVSYPQTDLYIPISVTVDSSGKIAITRAEDELI
ncbi:MAG: DUF4738 domain-containing protein [Bacteroides sp.]|nr:DUF4738 domain-containing protein [Bacteroides sp.]